MADYADKEATVTINKNLNISIEVVLQETRTGTFTLEELNSILPDSWGSVYEMTPEELEAAINVELGYISDMYLDVEEGGIENYHVSMCDPMDETDRTFARVSSNTNAIIVPKGETQWKMTARYGDDRVEEVYDSLEDVARKHGTLSLY